MENDITIMKYNIMAMCPTCSEAFLNNKEAYIIEGIYRSYKEREEHINYYIKLIKEIYFKYGISSPFVKLDTEYNPKLINPNYSSNTILNRISFVNNNLFTFTKDKIKKNIILYIKRRMKVYFNEDFILENQSDTSKIFYNYFYFLALDHTLSKLYLENKKYLKINKQFNETHRSILEEIIINKLGINNLHIKEKDDILVTQDDLAAMGYDELPSGYELENFLGPTGPKK